MEGLNNSNHSLVDDLYRKHSKKIFNYISARVNDRSAAENLAQDVWFRALTCGKEIQADTALPFLFRIASNLVKDYLRNLYVRQNVGELTDVDAAIEEMTPETEFYLRQLSELEYKRVKCLPSQRRIIYMWSRYHEMNVADISMELKLSARTVENHLRLGRRDVRDFIRAVC